MRLISYDPMVAEKVLTNAAYLSLMSRRREIDFEDIVVFF